MNLSEHRDAPADARETLILQQLDKLLAHDLFKRSDRLAQFLRYVVLKHLNGQSDELKETTIGAEVYGRPADYDPKGDPIVRTEARRLRKKLEEYRSLYGQEDRVIFTLPTGGYSPAFEFPAKILELPKPAPQIVPAVAPHRPVARKISPMIGAAGLFACGLIVVWWMRPPPAAREPVISPLTNYPGTEFDPSFSPDGRSVAFVWNGDSNNFDIYVKQMGVETPRRITTNPAHEIHPAWSPDGKEIAFLRTSPDQKVELTVVPAEGGPERIVNMLHPGQAVWSPDASAVKRPPGLAWSPDGKFLVTADRCSPQEGSQDCLYSITREGLERKKLTSPPAGSVADSSAAFSPDGNHIAFIRAFSDRGITEIFVQSLKDGSLRQLTSDQKTISALVWSSRDRLLFVSNRAGGNRIWSMPSSGGSPEVIAAAGRFAGSLAVSSDGGRMVYGESLRNSNVWRVNLSAETPQSAPVKLLSSTHRNDSAKYSPDGTRIAFMSDRSGTSQIWLANADGSAPFSLTSFPQATPVGTPEWSPDGRRIAFDSAQNGHSIIMSIASSGGAPAVVADGPGDNMMPSWSADGNFVYYLRRQSGPLAVWKKPIRGGAAALVVPDALSDALESADGKYLYFGRADGIWKIPVGGGQAEPVAELKGVRDGRYFTLNAQGIYYVRSAGAQQPEIDFFQFDTGRSKVIARPEKPLLFGTPSLSVTGDGKSMLYSQLDNSGMDLMMLAFR